MLLEPPFVGGVPPPICRTVSFPPTQHAPLALLLWTLVRFVPNSPAGLLIGSSLRSLEGRRGFLARELMGKLHLLEVKYACGRRPLPPLRDPVAKAWKVQGSRCIEKLANKRGGFWSCMPRFGAAAPNSPNMLLGHLKSGGLLENLGGPL